MVKFIRVIAFLSMIDGYNSTVNTDQRLCAGEKNLSLAALKIWVGNLYGHFFR